VTITIHVLKISVILILDVILLLMNVRVMTTMNAQRTDVIPILVVLILKQSVMIVMIQLTIIVSQLLDAYIALLVKDV